MKKHALFATSLVVVTCVTLPSYGQVPSTGPGGGLGVGGNMAPGGGVAGLPSNSGPAGLGGGSQFSARGPSASMPGGAMPSISGMTVDTNLPGLDGGLPKGSSTLGTGILSGPDLEELSKAGFNVSNDQILSEMGKVTVFGGQKGISSLKKNLAKQKNLQARQRRYEAILKSREQQAARRQAQRASSVTVDHRELAQQAHSELAAKAASISGTRHRHENAAIAAANHEAQNNRSTLRRVLTAKSAAR